MYTIKKTHSNKYQQEHEEIGIYLNIDGENVKWSNHFGKQFLKRLDIELPYNPEIPLLSTYPRELTT
jgi:hypothetical protein